MIYQDSLCLFFKFYLNNESILIRFEVMFYFKIVQQETSCVGKVEICLPSEQIIIVNPITLLT